MFLQFCVCVCVAVILYYNSIVYSDSLKQTKNTALVSQFSLFSHAICRFASFHETAKADAVLGYLIAFLVLLATVKLWHLLRLNPKLHMITATLQRAWADISGFLVVMAIMFLAYSIAVSSFPQLTSTGRSIGPSGVHANTKIICILFSLI